MYSLVSSGDNSSEIVVTVETNSRDPPDTLTELLTQPLEQRLQEFTNIDQQFVFHIIRTERHGKLDMHNNAVYCINLTITNRIGTTVNIQIVVGNKFHRRDNYMTLKRRCDFTDMKLFTVAKDT